MYLSHNTNMINKHLNKNQYLSNVDLSRIFPRLRLVRS